MSNTLNGSTNGPVTTSNWTSGYDHTVVAAAPEDCLVLGADTGGFTPWNNPDNIISHDIERAVDTAVGAVCMPVLFFISTPTNILNMLVFWKQGLKERVNLCLFYLSLVDFFHMFFAFLWNFDRIYLPFNTGVTSGPVFQFLIHHRLIGFRSLNWLSGCVSMLIACDRCLCVVNPLRSQTLVSTRATRLILALVTAFCVTCSVFSGLRFSLSCMFDPETKTTSMAFRTSQFFARHLSHLNVLQLFSTAVQPFVYVSVIMVTTLVTAVQLQAMVAWRAEMSSKALSTREVTLTRMLVAASVLYIVCSLPTIVIGTSILFIKDIGLDGRYFNFTMFVMSFFHLTSYINASFNFFIYYSLGSKYRSTLRELFGISPSL